MTNRYPDNSDTILNDFIEKVKDPYKNKDWLLKTINSDIHLKCFYNELGSRYESYLKDYINNKMTKFKTIVDYAFKFVLNSGKDITPQCLKIYIKFNVNLNTQNDWGNTILHLTDNNDIFDIIKNTVNNSKEPSKIININIINSRGDTPLHLNLNLDICTWLIDKGANINALNTLGNTPLYEATEKGIPKKVERLLLQNANPNIPNNKGNTPLFNAQYCEIAKNLISYGAKINIKNNIGDTPLHRIKFTDIAELLINKGANINATNNKGDTPLHIASAENNLPLITLLINKGANKNPKNKDGLTPYDLTTNNNIKNWLFGNGSYSATPSKLMT